MSSIGFSKNTSIESLKNRLVKHAYVKSPVFEIDDPSLKLIHIIGSYFFNEPQYYKSENVSELNETLNETTNQILVTALEIASNEKNSEDLLIIARWARIELNLRTTPIILLAIAASGEKTKKYVRKYSKYIIQRPDEIRQLFAAFLYFFSHDSTGKRNKGLPHCLTKALIDAFYKFKPQHFIKYNSKKHPTFKDVLLMLKERKGVPKYIFEYFVNNKLIITEEPESEIISSYIELNKSKDFDEIAKINAEKSFATWETLISKFGNKKEVWEFLIEKNLIKYMALLRNLRNIEKVEISDFYIEKVFDKISTEKNHKQFPFRFLSARKEINHSRFIEAIDLALEKSIEEIPTISGKTFVMIDCSGSMGALLSQKSTVSYKETAFSLGAIFLKKCGNNTCTCFFGSDFYIVGSNDNFSKLDPLISIIQKLSYISTIKDIEYGTNAYLPLKYIVNEKKQFDRIIIISDMHCYDDDDDDDDDDVPQLLLQYRQKINPNVKFYSINLAGHWQSQIDPIDKNCLLISGFNEKIVNFIVDFENKMGSRSIEIIRSKYKIY